MKEINSQEIDEIAELLLLDLELLDLHDVWDHAGSTRYGYVDPPDELAGEMVSEVLAPFLEEMKELSTPEEKQEYGLGIIKGLEQFKASESEFKDWAINTLDELINELKGQFP